MSTESADNRSDPLVGVYSFSPSQAWALIARLESDYLASWERNMYEDVPGGSFFVQYSRLDGYHVQLKPKSTLAKMRHGWMTYQASGGPTLSRDVQYRVDLQIAVENTGPGVKVTTLILETIDPFHARSEIQTGDYDPPSVLSEYQQMGQEIHGYLGASV